MAEGRSKLLGFAAGLLAAALAGGAMAAPAALIPAPQSLEPRAGQVEVADGARIAADPRDRDAALFLQDLALRTRGLHLKLVPAGSQALIVVHRRSKAGAGPEAYALDVRPGRIEVDAGSAAGLFYGAVTVWQLLTPDDGRGPVTVPALHVEDSPRFTWRGLMLDSARHYQSPAFIERLIDQMAAHKLNVLHWHLTDDQAWRLEIRKYPKLTEVGAWRVPAGAAGVDPATGKPVTYGGFYTQDQVRAIVAHAARRHVTVVPEIEMPGHALSAILAYPELGSDGAPPRAIQSDWGVFPWLYNVDDHTFAVLEDVLTEVMNLFPGPYIHIGGDEAVKDQWKASPAVQARMKALVIKSEDELQGWFTRRIATFLAAHGRRAIGWDEILQGGRLPDGAAVMSWHGIDGAVAAAKAGHDAVLAPAPTLYFDNRQSGRPQEPPGRGTIVGLRDVYAFDPAPASLTPDQRRHILGLQANLWTEHVRTEDQAEAMLFPRVAAVAETAWSKTSDWDGFSQRLPVLFDRYRALGIKADEAALAAPEAPSGRRRFSQDLDQCAGKLVLNLEDDAPATGPRARFLIDILQPCWIYRKAPLDGIVRLTAAVGQVPFNFQIGADRDKIALHPPTTAEGELEAHLDSCSGPLVATLPLRDAVSNTAVTTLSASIAPEAGAHDLCFLFTARRLDPMWAIDWVQLEPGGA